MLVLSRSPGESFVINLDNGEVITIYVGESRRGQTRISIDCPKRLNIRRSELPAAPLARSEAPATLPKGQLSKPPTTFERTTGVYDGADASESIDDAIRAEFELERSGK